VCGPHDNTNVTHMAPQFDMPGLQDDIASDLLLGFLFVCHWEFEGKRSLGRPRRRWEGNIKMDLQEVGGGCEDWMELAQDRDR